jgi:hypothetical protein
MYDIGDDAQQWCQCQRDGDNANARTAMTPPVTATLEKSASMKPAR